MLNGQRRDTFLNEDCEFTDSVNTTEVVYLEDATLLPCNVLQGLPKNSGVVQAERGDSGHHWLGNDVGAIVSSTHADLKDRRVDLGQTVSVNSVPMGSTLLT